MRADESAAGAGRSAGARALVLISLLAIFLVHPLILHGCSCGHDFDFHLLSWFEAAVQISHANLHPHWAYTPAWDAGEPRFIFYPPLSWYLGALLGLAFTHLPGASETAAWSAVPVAFTCIALAFSGMTMFRFARRYAGANASLLASAVYMANPYMLFTAFERAAYGELLAAAWMPLLMDGILAERVSVTGIAVPVALLWLTNAPAAVMGCYALALLAVVRIAVSRAAVHKQQTTENGHRRSKYLSAGRFSWRVIAGVAFGLALAAFYIVPAAYERRYVQSSMATIGGMRIDANFLFERTGSMPDDLLHDAVLRTASWIAVALLAATAMALVFAFVRNRRTIPQLRTLPIASLAALTVAVAFMLAPPSGPLWHHLPEMAFLQFPWRLLALLTPALALGVAAALSTSFERSSFRMSAIAALVMTAALGLPAYHLFRQACDSEDTVAARLALFHSNAGTDPTDEYTPASADNDHLQPGDRAWWLSDSRDTDRAAPLGMNSPRTTPTHFTIDAPRAQFLILNLRNYPAWRITLAHAGAAPIAAARAERQDGLTAIPVPAGLSTIDISYAQTLDHTAGDALSLFALSFLIARFFRRKSGAES